MSDEYKDFSEFWEDHRRMIESLRVREAIMHPDTAAEMFERPPTPEVPGHEGHELMWTSVSGFVSMTDSSKDEVEWGGLYCVTCREDLEDGRRDVP
jgi:hypothetical protein